MGVNLRGSRGDIVSSRAGLVESVLRRLALRSSGIAGGVVDGDMSYPVCDLGDLELEGVRYGVSVGDGSMYVVSSSMFVKMH